MISKYILVFTFFILILNLNCKKSFESVNICDCNSNDNSINMIFKYGVGAQNILNTFECKYTKDLIFDPPVNTCLLLNTNELDTILNKILDIDLFAFPDTFIIDDTTGTIGIIAPAYTYKLHIKYQTEIKEFYWKDEITNQNIEADKLRELFYLIIGIIQSKEEYQALPPAKGGYG
jgi:hypothetical protein